jgi:peroxiredoxin Q/BCP
MKKALRYLSLALTILVGLLTPRSAVAQQELKVGDPAPDFKLPGTDGKTYSLAELKGKTVVLAWFPKAFTGG